MPRETEMKAHEPRNAPKYAALAALFLLSGLAQAIEPPRVMFVSGAVKPVIIDLQGREIPARKGMVIEPGFSVKVPEGATLQIMTTEKIILAVRPSSLLKLESLGEGTNPHKLKLDMGGIRVANSEKKPHKFEVDTPNAKIKFDKGDNEAYYLLNGKLKDGRWGTFVRGFKDDGIVLSMPTGDVKVSKRDVGYVPGTGKGDLQLIARYDASGKTVGNPVSYVPGSKEIGTTEMVQNFQALGDDKVAPPSSDVSGGNTRSVAPPKSEMVTLPTPKDYSVKAIAVPDLAPPVKLSPIAGLDPKIGAMDLKSVSGVAVVKPPEIQKIEIVLAKDASGVTKAAALDTKGTLVLSADTPKTIIQPKLVICKKGQAC